MNKPVWVCVIVEWDGVGGVCYSLVSKSLPTRWEEPFPSPADPHKTHLSSILPLLCTTFPSEMLSTERIQHTTSRTKHGPRKEHISAMASPVQLFMSLPHLD
ncbi:hypothetical protein QQF64_004741 [Cirrhinus molitorella]|uniref:Uncharacterized protein n=1 Tax=Cirrhinus molitorella TaxID=172907 RepID=A0ABR3MJ90_9TELE